MKSFRNLRGSFLVGLTASFWFASHPTLQAGFFDNAWTGAAEDSQFTSSANWSNRHVPRAASSARIGGEAEVQIPTREAMKHGASITVEDRALIVAPRGLAYDSPLVFRGESQLRASTLHLERGSRLVWESRGVFQALPESDGIPHVVMDPDAFLIVRNGLWDLTAGAGSEDSFFMKGGRFTLMGGQVVAGRRVRIGTDGLVALLEIGPYGRLYAESLQVGEGSSLNLQPGASLFLAGEDVHETDEFAQILEQGGVAVNGVVVRNRRELRMDVVSEDLPAGGAETYTRIQVP